MRISILAILLSAFAATSFAQSAITPAGGESQGVVWSIESIASNAFGDDANRVSEGFIVPLKNINGGVAEIVNSEIRIFAYPNPVAERLNIAASEAGSFQWAISAIDGKTILKGNSAENRTEINCTTLPAGNYVLTVVCSDGEKYSSLIIKK